VTRHSGKYWWQRAWNRLVAIDDTPERIAKGVAVGVFLGIAPTPYVGTLIAAGLAAVFHYNMAAAVLASASGIFSPLIWVASSWLGGQMLGYDWRVLLEQVRAGGLLGSGGKILLAYLAGNLVLSMAGTAAAYFIARRAVEWNRRRAGVRGLYRPSGRIPASGPVPFRPRRGGGRRKKPQNGSRHSGRK